MAQQDLAARDYFTDDSLLADPFPYYEAVRANGPVWQEPNHGAFLVTGYDEIDAVFRDPTPSPRATRSPGRSHRCPADRTETTSPR